MQSKKLSLIESITNTVIGLIISVILQIIVFPLFGFNPSIEQNMQITLIFYVVSFARSFIIRRIFNLIK